MQAFILGCLDRPVSPFRRRVDLPFFRFVALISKALVTLIIAALGFLLVWIIIRLLSRVWPLINTVTITWTRGGFNPPHHKEIGCKRRIGSQFYFRGSPFERGS